MEEPLVGDPVNYGAAIALVAFGILIFLSGVLGNGFLLLVLATQRKLWEVHNIFIANLALADLVVICTGLPFVLLDLLLGYQPVVNHLHCEVNGFILSLAYSASILSLISVSFNRYMKVCHTNRFRTLFTAKKTVLYCFLLWVTGCLMQVPLLAGYPKFGYDAGAHGCQGRSVRKQVNYGGIVMSTVLVGPVFLIGYFNYAIFRKWNQSRSKVRGQKKTKRDEQPKATPTLGQQGEVEFTILNEISPESQEPKKTKAVSPETTISHFSEEKSYGMVETEPSSDNNLPFDASVDNNLPVDASIDKSLPIGASNGNLPVHASSDNSLPVDASGSNNLPVNAPSDTSLPVGPSGGNGPVDASSEKNLSVDAPDGNSLPVGASSDNNLPVGASKGSLPVDASSDNNLSVDASSDKNLSVNASGGNNLPVSASSDNSLLVGASGGNNLPVNASSEKNLSVDAPGGNSLLVHASSNNNLFVDACIDTSLPADASSNNNLPVDASSGNSLPIDVSSNNNLPVDACSDTNLPGDGCACGSSLTLETCASTCGTDPDIETAYSVTVLAENIAENIAHSILPDKTTNGTPKPKSLRQGDKKAQRASTRAEMALIRSLLVIAICLFALYTPFAICMLADYGTDVPSEIVVFAALLLYVNCAINWVIYGAMNTSFKQGYVETLRCLKSRCSCTSQNA